MFITIFTTERLTFVKQSESLGLKKLLNNVQTSDNKLMQMQLTIN